MVGVISFLVSPSALQIVGGIHIGFVALYYASANLDSTSVKGFIEEFIRKTAAFGLLADLCVTDNEINT